MLVRDLIDSYVEKYAKPNLRSARGLERRLRKDVEHATETVRDTVRKQEVEVEDDRGSRKPTGTGTVAEDRVVDPDLAGTSR